MTLGFDLYQWLLEQGPPSLDPQTPEDEDANFMYQEKLAQARAERDAEETHTLPDVDPMKLTNSPEINGIYANLRASQLIQDPTSVVKPPTYVPPDANSTEPEPLSSAEQVEPSPGRAAILNANLTGLNPDVQSRLLNVYKDTLSTGGSPQDAYRRFLIFRRDALAGDKETGWPEFPDGSPNPEFWKKYNGEREAKQGADARPSAIAQANRELYNSYRTKGIPAYSDEEISGDDAPSRVRAQLVKTGLAGKGPLDPFEAIVAMREFEKARYEAAGQPAPPSTTFGNLFLEGAMNAPFAPIGGAGALATGFLQAAGVRAINENLPEGTPDSVRTAISFSVYGLGNRGTAARRLLSGLEVGAGAAVGGGIAEAVGAPEALGIFTGPVITPAIAGAVSRHFTTIVENAAREGVDPKVLQEAIGRQAIDLGPQDLGVTVAIGDNFGTVTALPSKDLLNITLDNGLNVTVRREEVLYLPGTGKADTIASEAQRLRTGVETAGDEGMVISTQGIKDLPLGEAAVHYTTPGAAQSILRDGFIPSQASRESYPGVYVTTDAKPIAEAGSSGRSDAVFVEAPRGAIADADTAERVRLRLGVAKDADGNTAVAQDLQRQGYVGLDQRPGSRVYFDPKALKARMAAPVASAWDDFMEFAKGVMTGDARVTMVHSVEGGATIPGLSPEANVLLAAATNNALDRKLMSTALRAAARPKKMPGSVIGAVYMLAKSAIGMNPGLRRMTQPAVYAAANYAESEQMVMAVRLQALEKSVSEAFGPQYVNVPESPHLLSQYTGPALQGKAGDYVVGTLAHTIDQPELYSLTPIQKQVIELWQTLLKSDAANTERLGIGFDLIEREYIPYRRTELEPTFLERLLEPKANAASISSKGKPFFTKARSNKSIQDWAESLAAHQETAELDPFKLYLARLQGTARLRADQIYLKGVLANHGTPINSPKQIQALRKTTQKMKNQLTGRLQTAIRQDSRAGAQDDAFVRLDNLLQDTEKALQKVDGRLNSTRSGMDSPEWNQLEGALKALDKQADRVAATAQRSQETLTRTETRLARTKAEIAVLKGQLRGLQAQVNALHRASAPPGWTEVGIGRLKQRMAVPDDVAREMNLVMAPQDAGDIAVRVYEGLQFMRSVLLSADGSFMTQQGYAVAVTDPIRTFKTMGDAIIISLTEEGFTQYMAQNLDAFTRYSQAGGTVYTRATDVVSGAGKKSAVDRVPGIAQINNFGYGRLLPVMKMQQFKTLVTMLENIQQDKTLLQQVFGVVPFAGPKANDMLRKWAGVDGLSTQQIEAVAADTLNNIGGGINYAKLMTRPNWASQMIFLTEGWMRANVGRIINSAKVGDPAGVLARRWMMQNLMIGATISTGMSMMLSGRMPNYDPTAPDFLDIQVGAEDDLEGGSIPFLPGKTYIRAVFQSIAGVPWETDDGEIEQRVGALFRFGQGRTGQLPRLAMDLESGRDYLGRPITNPALHIARNLIPVVGQNTLDAATEQSSGRGLSIGLGAIGLNWIPRNPFDARDAYIQKEGYRDPVSKEPLRSYSELTDSMRADFDAKSPEFTQAVVKWQEERDSPFVHLRAVRDSHRAAVEALGRAFQGKPLSDSDRALLGSDGANIEQVKGNTTLYRQLLGNLSSHYREEAARQPVSGGEFAPQTAAQEVVAGYYTEVVDKSKLAGGLDYAMMDANERAYRRFVEDKYGEAGIRVLDEELLFRTTDDPVAQAYHKDQTLWNPYFSYLDSFWSADNLKSSGFDEDAAETAARFPNKEQYQSWLGTEYVEQLVGKALPSNLYNYRTSAGADTLGQKWGIVPGKRLTEQQAQDIAEELVRVQLKKYSDRLVEASNVYLKENSEALCAMSYWGITEPTEAVRPYLALCTRGRVPGGP